jgi:pilus assembly protein FimV
MSFDLDVGDLPQFGEAPAAPSFTPGDTQIKDAPKADQMAAGGNDLALDFDLDLGSSNIAPPAAPDQNVEIGSGGLDFDLKLGDSYVAPHLDETPGNRADLSAINLDLGQSTDTGMMDLESTMLAVPGSMDSMATNILGGAGAGGGNALEQAVATKLDLARAYEEMGDAEGARDLLQEALAEGTDAQKATAGAMLAKLG